MTINKHFIGVLLGLAFINLIISCNGTGSKKQFADNELYDFSKPVIIKLPVALDEISGIAYYPKDSSLFAIIDEDGLLYKIPIKDPNASKVWRFDKKRDYEDLVLVDSTFYVLVSNEDIEILYWLALFIVTQLYIEINEKYSPGVFIDIILGKYTIPKVENSIIMFIDLKDSTPIAEKLGHQQYFLFIREFIHDVSLALIEHNGRIYQYVGDEVVVSWLLTKKNMNNSLLSVIESRKNIQRQSQHYRSHYGLVPEFRVGIHVGDVTVGEIGIIKKDLAMSGDTMNITARIRSACNELNQKFIVSAAFIKNSNLKSFQSESLGQIDLKGITEDLELFALKI